MSFEVLFIDPSSQLRDLDLGGLSVVKCGGGGREWEGSMEGPGNAGRCVSWAPRSGGPARASRPSWVGGWGSFTGETGPYSRTSRELGWMPTGLAGMSGGGGVAGDIWPRTRGPVLWLA